MESAATLAVGLLAGAAAAHAFLKRQGRVIDRPNFTGNGKGTVDISQKREARQKYGTQDAPVRVETEFINGRGRDEGVTWTSPPHPDWKPGDKQPNPWNSSNFQTLDPSAIGSAAAYPLVISAITPRPIAFISSIDKAGVVNVSPYSYFNAMAHDPVHVCIGHCHSSSRETTRKDSLQNILETGEFVVGIMSEWFLEAANHTCGPYDADVDEMKLANLTPMPSERIKPPRVGEAAVQMECKLVHIYEVKNSKGELTTTIVIGEVVLMHILDEVASKSPHGKTVVDINKLRPISRFGGSIYGIVSSVFEIPRPQREAQAPLKPVD